MYVFMDVCMLLFHEKTTGGIWMKFGTEIDYNMANFYLEIMFPWDSFRLIRRSR